MALLKLILAIASLASITAAANINITSPPVTNWGVWGPFQKCPSGRFVQGFQLKTEPNQLWDDDTALNAVRLFCGDPQAGETTQIQSSVGDWGLWGSTFSCYPGFITGFQLRVEANQGSNADNTATNNVRFYCSNGGGSYIQGDGWVYGDWGQSVHCNSGQSICGIQTQVQPSEGGDDTSVNNVLFECCDNSLLNLKENMIPPPPPPKVHPKLAHVYEKNRVQSKLFPRLPSHI